MAEGINWRTTTASQNLSPQEITPQAASELFASCDRNAGRYSPLGLFYLKEGAQYIGIDNSSGNGGIFRSCGLPYVAPGGRLPPLSAGDRRQGSPSKTEIVRTSEELAALPDN